MSLKEPSESEYKRKRPESTVTKQHTDLSDELNDHEHTNKRMKSERPHSPALSYMSLTSDCDPKTNFRSGEAFPLHFREKSERAASPSPSDVSLRTDWSMDPPTNLKDFPLSIRVKTERAVSPSPSDVSLRTDWSMDPPANLKDFPSNTRVKSERAASPSPSYMSLRTDWSMDPPTNLKDLSFDTRRTERVPSPTPSWLSLMWTDPAEEPPTGSKAGDAFPLNPRLLTEHHLKCPVCKSLLKDPVSTSCGHNCCRDCINAFWDNCSGVYVCPQCGEASETRPVLNTNTALAEVVKNLQQAGFSPALPAQAYAGPQDVACDFCTETEQRLKAVKTCSNCDVFLCETHVRQHYTIPALQKHTLSDVTGDMKTRPSQQIQSTESSSSGRQDQADTTQDVFKEEVRSISESVLNTSVAETDVPEEAAEIGTPETRVNKEDTDVRNLELLRSKLEQEVLELKKSVSILKEKKEKYYDEDEYYEDEDDSEEEDEDYDMYKDEDDFGAGDYEEDEEEEDEDCDKDYDDDFEADYEEEKEDSYDEEKDYDDYNEDYDLGDSEGDDNDDDDEEEEEEEDYN